MRYSILIYAAEGVFERLTPEKQEQVLQQHRDLQADLLAKGKFASAKLMPTSSAVTIRPMNSASDKPVVIDGPYTDTKESFAGFYIIDCDSLDEAIDWGGRLASTYVTIEVRPVAYAGGLLAADE